MGGKFKYVLGCRQQVDEGSYTYTHLRSVEEEGERELAGTVFFARGG